MDPQPTPDTQDTAGQDSAPPLSAIEAAGVAGVNERTIRRAISAGQLPATKYRGAFRISPTDLAAWQAQHEATAPPDRRADSGPDRATGGQSAVSGEGTATAELWRLLEDEKRETLTAKDETISRLAAEVASLRDRDNAEVVYLRDQLDQRSRELAAERERADVIQ